MNWNSKTSIFVLLLSIVSSIIVLAVVSGKVSEKNFDDLALGDKTTAVVEMLDGQQINYQNFMVDENATEPLLQNGKDLILSFGNSQSHSINSYREGKDHLFIYHLAKKFPKYNVINLSAPNADLQEMFLGLVNAESVFGAKIKTVFFSCVFDDTREYGIRTKMLPMVQKNKTILSHYPSGKVMIDEEENSEKESEDSNDTLLKYRAEKTLNDYLEAHSDIYASRGKIKGELETQIYFFRNWLFGIKPTTKRKKIDAVYSKNMQALKDIVTFCKKNHIELNLYIAPLRNDIEIPYVAAQYNDFKNDISKIYKVYNLENVVPGRYWGETNGDWVDFMHFKGEGHILLAEELEKILRKEEVK